MPNVKYTDSATFRCLENLKEGSLDISLIHTGKEHRILFCRRSDLEPYSRTDVCNLSK